MNINKIKLSGTTYSIQDENACKVVELTQAEYDALPATAKTSNSLFVITDAEAGDLSNYYTKTETSGATEISTALTSKQDTLVSGTNIKTINNESILGEGNITIEGGGGKAVSGGTNISITTGETADTINCTLPITASTSSNASKIIIDNNYSFISNDAVISGKNAATYTSKSIVLGINTLLADGSGANIEYNLAFGERNNVTASGIYKASASQNFILGSNNSIYNASKCFALGTANNLKKNHQFVVGDYNTVLNEYETLFGRYNVSSSASTTFGNSGNTLFSVGNGTAQNARHNAFEIRQNGDIYLTKDGQDVKLQDQLGGGGSTYTAGTGIDITNDVISVNSGVVTTNTEQTISGKKIFKNSEKPIEFKQIANDSKVGFSIKNTASTNNELATFEFRPNTFTIDNVRHPLLYFGHYRNTNIANAGVPQTVIGFRQYDQKNTAAYHYLIPLPEKAKTPFSLTTSFKNYYAPIGFKNGSTMITADDTGVVDLSSEFSSKVETSAVTSSITSASTDSEVPSAKAVYDAISAGGGGVNVVQTTGTSTTDVMSQDVVTTQLKTKLNDVGVQHQPSTSNYSQLNLYLNKEGAVSQSLFTYVKAINGKSITSQNKNNLEGFSLIETSAITTSITSASTDSQVPSAKAVYDMVGNINTILESI